MLDSGLIFAPPEGGIVSCNLGQGPLIRRGISQVRAFLILGLGLVHVTNVFVASATLGDIALVLMIVVTGMCLAVVKGSSRVISYLAFAISIGLLIGYRAPWSVWASAFEENLYMVVMFAMVPLLRIPIRYGGYFEALRAVFDRFVDTRSRFYVFVGLVSAFIGAIVNLAVVPLVYEVSRASRFSIEKRLLSAAVTRGFTSSTIWAPTMASIALIMHLTGAKWLTFFPFGLSAGIVAGVVGYAVTMLETRHLAVLPNPAPVLPNPTPGSISQPLTPGRYASGRREYVKFAELCGFALSLIVIIALVSFVTGIRTITVVSLSALIFPLVWMGILRRLRLLATQFKVSYLGESLPNLTGEVTLFVAAGFFAVAIEHSGLGTYIPRALTSAVGGNVFLFTMAVVASAILLAVVGVHPIVTVAVIGGTVKAAAVGVSPTYLALVLAMCWAIGLSVSPASATIITMSGLTNRSPLQVGTRWNSTYAIATTATLIALLTGLRLAGIL
jgi:hypothetical protein